MRTWSDLDAARRASAVGLRKTDVPTSPGVYAWYRSGSRVYVGKAADLRDRIWTRHLGQSRTLGTSAFRRNVAESLGCGSAADIKARRIQLSTEQLAAVRAWIVACDVAWLTCPTEADAVALETALKRQFLPRLTKL